MSFNAGFLKTALDPIRGSQPPLLGGGTGVSKPPPPPGQPGPPVAPEGPKMARHRPIPPRPRVTPTMKPGNPPRGLKGLTGAPAQHPYNKPIARKMLKALGT